MVDNPFIISGRYISDDYFCDREMETEELVSNIINWRNSVLISPRRMGKSGLIARTFGQKEIVANLPSGISVYQANLCRRNVLM